LSEDLIDLPKEAPQAPVIDFQKMIGRLLRNIHWVILFALLGFFIAKTYLRYQVSIYKVATTLYLGSEIDGTASNILKTAGLLEDRTNTISNEILIFRSYDLIAKVVDSLHLQTEVETLGRIKKKPISLPALPVQIQMLNPENASNKAYEVSFKEAGFLLKDGKAAYNFPYNTPVSVGVDSFIVVPSRSVQQISGFDYSMNLLQKEVAVDRFLSKLSIAPSKSGVGMLDIAMVDEYPERAEEFIKVLIYFYNKASLSYKNEAIKKSLEFLDSRLEVVRLELEEYENSVRDFKKVNRLMDVSYEASTILGYIKNNEQRDDNLVFNNEILSMVEKIVTDIEKGEDLIPSGLSISDPILINFITQYNSFVLQKRRIKEQGTLEDPTLPLLNANLDELRKNILKSTKNIRAEFNANKRFTDRLSGEYEAKFQSLPEKEKELIQIRRQLGIKESLYTFLLRTKEEAAVKFVTSNVSTSRIIDMPRSYGMIFPQSKNIFLMCIGSLAMIPVVLIVLLEFLNKKIETKRDIETRTQVPIVGEINEVPKPHSPIVVQPGSRDIIVEQYRTLRTNLNYLGVSTEKQIILVTSFMRDEGKSFTSLNLSSILAQTGKKVVLLEFDLRKPKLSLQLKIDNAIGISNYITGNATITQVIKPVEAIPNLSIISSGPISPNPAELLLDEKVAILFKELRATFDYIVIDSAPVGLVSDTFSITKFADITLYIVRHKLSLKPTLTFLQTIFEEKKLPHVGIVINGIKTRRFEYGYGYGAYYSSYSGEDVYGKEQPVKANFLKNLFSKKH